MVEWINVVLALVQAICALVALRLSIGPPKEWWHKLRQSTRQRASASPTAPALSAPEAEAGGSEDFQNVNNTQALNVEVANKSRPVPSNNFGFFSRRVTPFIFVGLTLVTAFVAYMIEFKVEADVGNAPSLSMLSVCLTLVLLMLCLAYTDAVLNVNFLGIFLMTCASLGVIQTIGGNLFGSSGSLFVNFIPLAVLELMRRNPHTAAYQCLVVILGIICSVQLSSGSWLSNAFYCLVFALAYRPPQVTSASERLYWMVPALLFLLVATASGKTVHFIGVIGGYLEIDYFHNWHWQALQYRDALLSSNWFSGSDHSMIYVLDLSGSGWPIAIAVTYGLVYALGAALLLLTFSGVVLSIAFQCRSVSPELLTLITAFSVALLINLGVATAVMPTISITPASFGGASGYVAGGAYMSLLFLYLSRAMQGIGSGTLIAPIVGPGVLSAKDKLLVYLGFADYHTRKNVKGEQLSGSSVATSDVVRK